MKYTHVHNALAKAIASTAMIVASAVTSTVSAAVPVPSVAGPIPSELGSSTKNYTFFATDLDLASRGYVEEEFFFSGTANTYDATIAGGIGARPVASPTANVTSSGHPYKTRMVVRRPASPKQFNGTVVVEWMNATSNYDVEALWFRAHEFFMREGYVWVGITAQSGPVTNPTLGLKAFSPARYGNLDLTAGGALTSGDLLSYDVYAQGVQAVRHAGVLGPLASSVKNVVGAGVSQSAGRLSVFLNAIQPRDQAVVDAALLYIGGEKLRTDLPVPIIKLLSETEYTAPASANEITSLQPDTDRLRVWSMAGTSHSDWASYAVRYALLRRDQPSASLRDICANPSRSRIPDRHAIAASIDWLKRWSEMGATPPPAPPIQLEVDGVTVRRDGLGNALGGIRLAPFAVPVALDTGYNTNPPNGAGLCFLNGTHVPFDTQTLNRLYPDHRTYVQKFDEAVSANVRDGFVLPADAKDMLDDARKSLVGDGLTCGPLCANTAQFPIQPSTGLLRDHVKFLYMKADENLLASVDAATRFISLGDSQPDTKQRAQRYAQAASSLQTFKLQLAQHQQSGRATKQQQALLTEYADILIAELTKLGTNNGRQ
jgi:hypothetical protein